MVTTRSIVSSLAERLERQNQGEALVCCVEISSPEMLVPRRFVNDVVDWQWDKKTWKWFPFDIRLLKDADGTPEAQLVIPDVSADLWQGIDAIYYRPQVNITILDAAEFDLTVRPRVPLDGVTPNVPYQAPDLFLVDVTSDGVQTSGKLVGWDYIQETFPWERCTKDVTPALYLR